MNKEQLQKRINQLMEERKQKESLLHVYDGAIQDCQYWLNQLNEKASQKKNKDSKQKEEKNDNS